MSDDLPDGMPPEEAAIRHELGEAMMDFVLKILELAVIGPRMAGEEPRKLEFDVPVRQHITENYRLAVEKAAAQGIEVALCWHSLGVWTEEGKERIGYFSRALACMEAKRDSHLV